MPIQREEFIPDGDLDTDRKVWLGLVYWRLMALSTHTGYIVLILILILILYLKTRNRRA